MGSINIESPKMRAHLMANQSWYDKLPISKPNTYTVEGPFCEASDFGITSAEDWIVVKHTDGKYYALFYQQFPTPTKMLYAKADDPSFDTITEYGTAWNQDKRRFSLVDFNPDLNEYHAIAFDLDNLRQNSVRCPAANFPTGWTDEQLFLDKGGVGDWDEDKVAANSLCKLSPSYGMILLYYGIASGSSQLKIGICRANNLRSTPSKNPNNPFFWGSGNWYKASNRDALQVGNFACVLMEQKPNVGVFCIGYLWIVFGGNKAGGATFTYFDQDAVVQYSDIGGGATEVANPCWLHDWDWILKNEKLIFYVDTRHGTTNWAKKWRIRYDL